MTIYKYPLAGGVNTLPLPAGADLLHVHDQGGTPFLWAEVDPTARVVERVVHVVGTGHEVPRCAQYIGTVHLEQLGLVLHAFEDVGR